MNSTKEFLIRYTFKRRKGLFSNAFFTSMGYIVTKAEQIYIFL